MYDDPIAWNQSSVTPTKTKQGTRSSPDCVLRHYALRARFHEKLYRCEHQLTLGVSVDRLVAV